MAKNPTDYPLRASRGKDRVAVIGSGISGLACAHALTRAGVEVQVFEREERVGGRMRTRTTGGLAFDLGANFLIAAYTNLRRLAGEVGVGLLGLGPVRHAVMRQGQLHTMNFESLRDVIRMDTLGLWSKVRFLEFVRALHHRHPGLDFFDLGRCPDNLNFEDAYSYARREVGEEFADYILDAFHTCVMFYRSSETSAAAFLALLSMKTDPSQDFSVIHAAGEMQEIPDAIASGVPVRTSCPVHALRRCSDGWRVRTRDGEERYSQVLLATTASAALRVLDDPLAAHRQVLAGTRYAATVNLCFRVPQELLGRTHCFYVPFRESTLISEFTNEALKGGKAVSHGSSLVNVGLHEVAARAMMGSRDKPLFALVGRELSRLYPPLADAVPHDLQRWKEAMPKYDPGQLTRVKEFLARGQGLHGLFLCGDYLSSPWLEGASRCGSQVAARILAACDQRETALR